MLESAAANLLLTTGKALLDSSAETAYPLVSIKMIGSVSFHHEVCMYIATASAKSG